MANRRPILYKHHIHTALSEAVAAMKEREESTHRPGWKSTQREVLEDALTAMNEGRPVDILNYDP